MIFEIEIDAQLLQRAVVFASHLLDHAARLVVGHAADDRHAGLDDARLFAGDRGQRVAQLLV